MATAAPNVTTARLMPRTRIAGTPTATPSGKPRAVAPAIAAGIGQPWRTASHPAVNAPNPAMAHWARVSSPRYPVTTTTERQTMA